MTQDPYYSMQTFTDISSACLVLIIDGTTVWQMESVGRIFTFTGLTDLCVRISI